MGELVITPRPGQPGGTPRSGPDKREAPRPLGTFYPGEKRPGIKYSQFPSLKQVKASSIVKQYGVDPKTVYDHMLPDNIWGYFCCLDEEGLMKTWDKIRSERQLDSGNKRGWPEAVHELSKSLTVEQAMKLLNSTTDLPASTRTKLLLVKDKLPEKIRQYALKAGSVATKVAVGEALRWIVVELVKLVTGQVLVKAALNLL
jgi:hypothetical protein